MIVNALAVLSIGHVQTSPGETNSVVHWGCYTCKTWSHLNFHTFHNHKSKYIWRKIAWCKMFRLLGEILMLRDETPALYNETFKTFSSFQNRNLPAAVSFCCTHQKKKPLTWIHYSPAGPHQACDFMVHYMSVSWYLSFVFYAANEMTTLSSTQRRELCHVFMWLAHLQLFFIISLNTSIYMSVISAVRLG